MTMAKVALSIPEEVLRKAKKEVAIGHAKSLSSFVSEALDEKLQRDALTASRIGVAGSTRSTRWAAAFAIRRSAQLGHRPRSLHEKATKRS